MIRNRAGFLSTLALATAASIVWLASLEAVLDYRIAEVASGDWWRIATGHLAHWTREQLLWDSLTLLILGVVFDRIAADEPRRLIVAIVGSTLAIPLALTALQPELHVYRGLSGIDAALFVLVGALALKRSEWRVERIVVGLALSGFVAKVAVEIVTGTTLFVQDLGTGVVAVPLAHAVGALVGLLAAMGGRQEAGADANPRRADRFLVDSGNRVPPGGFARSRMFE